MSETARLEQELEQELERRLAVIEAEEAADPVHAALSARSLALFIGAAAAVVVLSVIGAAL